MSLNKAFREIGRVSTARSAFDLSHYNLSTHNMGLLYPVMCKFTMPGDKWVIDVDSVIRAMPLVYPAYVDIDVNYHFYFVPSRLLDDDFEEFITGGEDGDYTDTLPKLFDDNPGDTGWMNSGTVGVQDLVIKRLGLFPYNHSIVSIFTRTNNVRTNLFPRELLPTSLPLRGYYFIWNEYYRDENLQSKILFKNINNVGQFWNSPNKNIYYKDVTKIPTGINGYFFVAWLKDYFTSALPFQQRGTAPIVPFSGDIELKQSGQTSDINLGGVANLLVRTAGSNRYLGTDRNAWASGNVVAFTDYIGTGNKLVVANSATSDGEFKLRVDPQELAAGLLSDIKANIFDGLSVSDLRVAVQLQKFFERNARGGVRYTEFLDSHYNVSPSDARLDRPEFLGGCKFPVVISDVTSTAVSTDGTSVVSDLGSYAGKALSGNSESHVVNYFVEEFGYIYCLFFIRPKTLYFQGLNREFQYSTNLEYPFPEFMHLSEQGITNSEIYVASSTSTFDPTKIFGYQGIFDELRYGKNTVSGSLAEPTFKNEYFPWHLGRFFDNDSLPQLNSRFIECRPRNDIFQIQDDGQAQFIIQHKFGIKCVRPMPIIGEPGLVDHF